MPLSVWARGDSSTAGNASLNASTTTQQPTTLLTFSADTNNDGIDDGDLKLDFTLDGSIDPDTVIYLDTDGDGVPDSEPITFTMELGGTLPNTSKLNGVGPNNTDLRGEEIVILVLEDGTRLFFLTSFFFDPDGPNAATESQDTFDIMEDFPNGAHNLGNLFVCFVAGTAIDTPNGTIAIEDLKAGDLILTEGGGSAEVLYAASQTFSESSMRAFSKLRPIVVPRNAIAQNEPNADLLVSPLHRILIRDAELQILFGLDAAFIAARDLPYVRPAPFKDTTYVHVLCQDHSVIRANGCESETLFPGDVALSSVSPGARERIEATLENIGTQKTAYPCLTAQEASFWRDAVQRREKRIA